MSDAPDLSPEAKKKRGQRNLAIALGLIGFIAVVYLVTILKIAGNIGGAS
ncbi:MAG TPA: hypothetical protein PKM48_06105 [Parvularculaceae bacterium]|nr:hypothetical protein [Parvularculaceae bacterium]